jgi:hypothetical protein
MRKRLGWGRRVTNQGDDDLAIRSRLEVIRLLQVLADKTVVVDLAVDGEDDGVIAVGKGLSAGLFAMMVLAMEASS